MTFDNEYPNRKDQRKPYRDSRRFDRTCRCHGGCPWCEGTRMNRKRNKDKWARQQIREED